MSGYLHFIPEFVLCTNSSLFWFRIANELSEFRNYLSVLFYRNAYVLSIRRLNESCCFQPLAFLHPDKIFRDFAQKAKKVPYPEKRDKVPKHNTRLLTFSPVLRNQEHRCISQERLWSASEERSRKLSALPFPQKGSLSHGRNG